jgi:hypothetical protein
MRIFIALGALIFLLTARAVEITQPPGVEFTASNAVVYWATDVATGTRAEIFPSTAKVSVPDKTPASAHIVNLSGLKPGTTYTVTVGSARAWLATNTFTTTGKVIAPTNVSAVKKTAASSAEKKTPAPSTRKIWGNYASLPDHFERHGADFHAQDADDYARLSWEFLQRAKAEGLPAKQDDEGVLRIYDPRSGTFASYNRDGTTKTFFKPGSADYFERQPGDRVKLKLPK